MQGHHPVVEVSEQPLDLVIEPFVQRHPRLARRQDLQAGRAGRAVFIGKIEPALEHGGVVRRDRVLGAHPVNLRQFVARVAETPRPAPVIGEQHQPGAVEIEPPGQMQVGGVGGVQAVQHRAMVAVAGGAHAAGRFVQHPVGGAAHGEGFAVQRHRREGPHLVAAVLDHPPVHGDAAGGQQQPHAAPSQPFPLPQKAVQSHQSRLLKGALRLL